MKISGSKGFSLIEVLIVSVILSILFSSLYLALSVGMSANVKSERFLMDEREQDVFITQLMGELRGAIPYSRKPFEGKEDQISFPSRLRHYSLKGFQEGIYGVDYKFSRGSLVRSEHPLKRESLKQSARPEKETVFEKLKEFRFEYLYVTKTGEMRWRKDWAPAAGASLPRGIRLVFSGGVFGEKMQVREILVPQGVVVAVSS